MLLSPAVTRKPDGPHRTGPGSCANLLLVCAGQALARALVHGQPPRLLAGGVKASSLPGPVEFEDMHLCLGAYVSVSEPGCT